ncbi:MAG: folate-binding protein [Pseudomonadota bacterium]
MQMARGVLAASRSVLRVGGTDHRKFLQDLVTNNVDGLSEGAVYAALLTPQGKYLSDFLMVADGDGVLLDVAQGQAQDLGRRLSMYKLRAAVTLEDSGLSVVQGWGAAPEGAVADPRHGELGWRVYTTAPDALLADLDSADPAEWDALRVRLGVPEAGAELLPNDSYILEAGFDRLNGVDFRKGCYVGQEVTARMRHKTELRKGLARVSVTGEAPPAGTPVEAGGKAVGTLYTVAGGEGLAHLRFDRATGEMQAGAATVVRLDG